MNKITGFLFFSFLFLRKVHAAGVFKYEVAPYFD